MRITRVYVRRKRFCEETEGGDPGQDVFHPLEQAHACVAVSLGLRLAIRSGRVNKDLPEHVLRIGEARMLGVQGISFQG
jgi:hypothetical protein